MNNAQRLHRIVELTAELEQLLGGQATFLHGDNGDDIRGILVADREVTEDILGESADKKNMN